MLSPSFTFVLAFFVSIASLKVNQPLLSSNGIVFATEYSTISVFTELLSYGIQRFKHRLVSFETKLVGY